jgi:hypothetical protein
MIVCPPIYANGHLKIRTEQTFFKTLDINDLKNTNKQLNRFSKIRKNLRAARFTDNKFCL